MSTHDIDAFGTELESIRERIDGSQMNVLRDILPDKQILSACREAGHEFRRRLLTPVVTVFHMIAPGDLAGELVSFGVAVDRRAAGQLGIARRREDAAAARGNLRALRQSGRYSAEAPAHSSRETSRT